MKIWPKAWFASSSVHWLLRSTDYRLDKGTKNFVLDSNSMSTLTHKNVLFTLCTIGTWEIFIATSNHLHQFFGRIDGCWTSAYKYGHFMAVTSAYLIYRLHHRKIILNAVHRSCATPLIHLRCLDPFKRNFGPSSNTRSRIIIQSSDTGKLQKIASKAWRCVPMTIIALPTRFTRWFQLEKSVNCSVNSTCWLTKGMLWPKALYIPMISVLE